MIIKSGKKCNIYWFSKKKFNNILILFKALRYELKYLKAEYGCILEIQGSDGLLLLLKL